MSKSTPNSDGQIKTPNEPPTADQILQNFNDPLNFTVYDLQRTLLRVYNDTVTNKKNSILDEKDFYALYELGVRLDEIQAYITETDKNS